METITKKENNKEVIEIILFNSYLPKMKKEISIFLEEYYQRRVLLENTRIMINNQNIQTDLGVLNISKPTKELSNQLSNIL